MKNFFSSNLVSCRKSLSLTQEKAALSLGLKRNTYANYESEHTQPDIDTILKIASFFGISVDKLLNEDLSKSSFSKEDNTGKKGSKVKVQVENLVEVQPILDQKSGLVGFSMQKVVTVDNFGNENMVLVPVRARAGYLNGYGDTEFISQLPSYRLPNFTNGTYRMFEVQGLSMHNTFNDKDILITKFIESLDFIKDDRIYVVVTKSEGVVVKRVLNRVNTDGKLILKSDNYKERELYPNMVISPEDVLEIWYCVAYMSRIMRAPAEMYTRVIDLEGRLTLLEANLKKGIT